MRWFLLFVCLLAPLIFATDWHSLGVAAEPLDTTCAFSATATEKLNFRAGPGTQFAILGTVPRGDTVTVLGWLIHDSIYDYLGTGTWVRAEYKGRRGWVCAYLDDINMLERESKPLFPIQFLALNPLKLHDYLKYIAGYWELCLAKNQSFFFDYIESEGDRQATFYSGPGFGYAELDLFDNGLLLFVEGEWALVNVYPDLGWIHIGDESRPRIRAYSLLGEMEAPYPQGDYPELEDGGAPSLDVYKTVWPETKRLLLQFRGPFFCILIKMMKVRDVKIYQPPNATTALDDIVIEPVIHSGWHETVIEKYPIELGSSFNPQKLFRLCLIVDYGKYGTFTMDSVVGQ